MFQGWGEGGNTRGRRILSELKGGRGRNRAQKDEGAKGERRKAPGMGKETA